MKKFVVAFLASIISTAAFGYTVTIENRFNDEIKADIHFAGPGICAEKSVLIPKGKTREVETGICCVTDVFIEAGGKRHAAQPSRTGLGMSCKDNTFVVKRDKNGRPVTERK